MRDGNQQWSEIKNMSVREVNQFIEQHNEDVRERERAVKKANRKRR